MTTPLDGTILITGASSGIGEALARGLAGRAAALILVARRRERLEALAAELGAKHPALKAYPLSCDLQDRCATRLLLETVENECGPVDVLINNAGTANIDLLERQTAKITDLVIGINVTALAFLTQSLLPGMIARGRGGILNVSSGFGLTFMPGFATYAGTKHFVTGFTECLRLETIGTGVTVSQLCPGPVRTELETLAGNPAEQEVPSIVQISAEQCAREAIRGFARGKAMIVPGFVMRMVLRIAALSPRALHRFTLGFAGRAFRKKLGA